MTVEEDIFNTLRGLVDDRVYPDEADFGSGPPLIIYQQVGGDPLNFLAGVPDKRNGRFQVNVWAESRMEAAALIRQVEDALRLAPALLANTLGGPLSTREPALNLYGYTQDFSIWFTN